MKLESLSRSRRNLEMSHPYANKTLETTQDRMDGENSNIDSYAFLNIIAMLDFHRREWRRNITTELYRIGSTAL